MAALAIAVVASGVFFSTFEQVRRGREFREHLADADHARGRGELDVALASVDRALGLRPGDASTELLRRELEEELRISQGEAAAAEAESHIQDLESIGAERERHAATVNRLGSARRIRWLLREEREEYERACEALAGTDHAFEQIRSRVEHAMLEANRTLTAERVDELRARLASTLWRLAVASGDASEARLMERRVEQYDPDGPHLAEMRSPGSLTLTSRPSGLEVHLLRFRLHSELVDGGDARLVPVPLHGTPAGSPPARRSCASCTTSGTCARTT